MSLPRDLNDLLHGLCHYCSEPLVEPDQPAEALVTEGEGLPLGAMAHADCYDQHHPEAER